SISPWRCSMSASVQGDCRLGGTCSHDRKNRFALQFELTVLSLRIQRSGQQRIIALQAAVEFSRLRIRECFEPKTSRPWALWQHMLTCCIIGEIGSDALSKASAFSLSNRWRTNFFFAEIGPESV